MVVLQFHVPPEVLKALREEAERNGKTLSVVARDWLMKGKKVEDERKVGKLLAIVLLVANATAITGLTCNLIWMV